MTNLSRNFLRNRIRLDLVPTLQQVDQRSKKNILKTINSMRETEEFIKKIALHHLHKTTRENNVLDIKKFFAIDDTILKRRVILEWLYTSQVPFNISTKLIDEIIRFLNNKKSTTHQFDTWQISKKKFRASIIKTSINPHQQPIL